jgi:hypothetical protein
MSDVMEAVRAVASGEKPEQHAEDAPEGAAGAACVFRRKADTDSDPSRTLIPI